MLGRGGFSEVWKALDLVKLDEVAIKVYAVYFQLVTSANFPHRYINLIHPGLSHENSRM